YSAVFTPRRAAAIAASHPAWPAPTTTTSNCSVNACMKVDTRRAKILAVTLAIHSNKLAATMISITCWPAAPSVYWLVISALPRDAMNTAEFSAQLDARIAKYDLLCHPFYKAWADRKSTRLNSSHV